VRAPAFLIIALWLGTAEASCWEDASRRYNVAPVLLQAIAKQESGFNPRARSVRNADGSYDIGLMQINSAHLPMLARLGIREADLYEPCTSIHVGAWLLSQNFRRMGHSWLAVGAYNAASHAKRAVYARRIHAHIFKPGARPAAQPERGPA